MPLSYFKNCKVEEWEQMIDVIFFESIKEKNSLSLLVLIIFLTLPTRGIHSLMNKESDQVYHLIACP